MTRDRLSVGVVTPHKAAGPEVELPAMSSGRLGTSLFRSGSPAGASQAPVGTGPPAHADLRWSTEPAVIDRAAVTFRGQPVDSVAHASTTAGYVIGPREEAAAVDRISQRFGLPAVTSCAAAVTALRTHGIEHVQLVHPPWFDNEFDTLGAAYFQGQGFDAVVTTAVGLLADPARVEPQHVVDRVEHHIQDLTEAVVLAGAGLRAAGAVEELELCTGRLVLEANQALLWGILAATGAGWDITGYGRLLRAKTPTM